MEILWNVVSRLKKVEWQRVLAVLAALLVVCVIVYVLLYLPLQKELVLDQQDQFQWNVFSLFLTVLVTYWFANWASKREVLREARATARSATYRILQAKTGVQAIMDNIKEKRATVNSVDDTQTDGVNGTVFGIHLHDLYHQAEMVGNTLLYAEYDWKEILAEDIAKQFEADDQLANAYQEIAQLQTLLSNNVEKMSELERDSSENAQAQADKRKLQLENEKLRLQLDTERARANTAANSRPFPTGAASIPIGGAGLLAGLGTGAGAGSPFVQPTFDLFAWLECSNRAKSEAALFLKSHPSATDAEILNHLEKRGLSKSDTTTVLNDPAIKAFRSP